MKSMTQQTLCKILFGMSLSFLGPSFLFTLTASAQSNPLPFIGQPLLPDAIAPGGGNFTLTVNGTGFVSGSVVNWNGSPRPTKFANSKQLTAMILASDIAAANVAAVTVVSPAPGGGISIPIFFPVATETASVGLSRADFQTDQLAFTVVTGDFNGDGNLDLATVDILLSTVTVLLGNGDGSFQPQVQIPVGSTQFGMVTADFNRDGKLDFAVPNGADNTVSILLGNGDGTFGSRTTFATGNDCRNLTTADFNRDGNLDLAVLNATANTVGVLLGNGDGTFGSHLDFATGQTPFTVTSDDFNGDGKLDLAVANLDGTTVSILKGNGDGTFQTQTTYFTGNGVQYVSSADFNVDGKPDLAVTDEDDNTIAILLNNGTGTFTAPSYYDTGANPSSVIPADFNADGKLDLVVTDSNFDRGGTSQLSIFLGNGDGTFQARRDYPAAQGPRTAVVADFNHDGRLDVATANNEGNSASVYLQAAAATLSASSLTFGTQVVSKPGLSQQVTLTNSGSLPLSINRITTTGDFRQTSDCGTSLAEGSHCDISVGFRPTVKGSRSGFLNIKDNAADSPQRVALAGTGTVVELSTPSLSFGTQTVGTASSPQTVALVNRGSEPLNISKIGIRGTNAGDFAQRTTCLSSLPPRGRCLINVRFKPTAAGARQATLNVVDDGGGSPQIVQLAGTGEAAK
jgi:hypothetical protein